MSGTSDEFLPETGAVTVFSTVWCGYCKQLKKILDAEGISYTEIDIEENSRAAELVSEANAGNSTVPTVLFADSSTLTNPSVGDIKKKLAA